MTRTHTLLLHCNHTLSHQHVLSVSSLTSKAVTFSFFLLPFYVKQIFFFPSLQYFCNKTCFSINTLNNVVPEQQQLLDRSIFFPLLSLLLFLHTVSSGVYPEKKIEPTMSLKTNPSRFTMVVVPFSTCRFCFSFLYSRCRSEYNFIPN